MRYESATQEVIDIYENIKREYFPELRNVSIMILLDTKKTKSKGKLCLGRIKRASEVEKYLTSEDVEEGYDYVMFLDKIMVDHCSPEDLRRIIRHEMRHIFITDRGKLTLQPHSLEDFYEEVELNIDDPRWALRVAEMISTIYEQAEDS